MEDQIGQSPTALHDIRNMINKCTWHVKVFVTSQDGNWEDYGLTHQYKYFNSILFLDAKKKFGSKNL